MIIIGSIFLSQRDCPGVLTRMRRVGTRRPLIWKRLQIRLGVEGRVVLVTAPCASRRVGLSRRGGQVDRDWRSATLSGTQADLVNLVGHRARLRVPGP